MTHFTVKEHRFGIDSKHELDTKLLPLVEGSRRSWGKVRSTIKNPKYGCR